MLLSPTLLVQQYRKEPELTNPIVLHTSPLAGKVVSFLIISLLPLLQYKIYNRGVVDVGSIFVEIFHSV